MCCELVGTSQGVESLRVVLSRSGIVVELNESLGLLAIEGTSLALTLAEAKVLRVLMCNAGRVVSVDELVDHVWGWSTRGNAHSVLSRMRKKVARELSIGTGANGFPLWFSRRGFGYVMEGQLM
jgi:DNA-binding response OmpR family regulator